MKALILAAGLGSRLAPLTNDRPKSLVQVNGTPILFKQIKNLLLNGIDDITVISGYRADVMDNAIHCTYPQVKIVENVHYTSTNNMYSAFIGRTQVMGGSFLLMNADVFFDASVLSELLSFPGENAIVTDIGSYNEESMKVIQREGRIVRISKQIAPEEALGCSIDVYKFSKVGGEAFFNKCGEYIEQNHQVKLWSEVALDSILSEVVFQSCPLNGRWVEIDNHEDLALAEKLFAGK